VAPASAKVRQHAAAKAPRGLLEVCGNKVHLWTKCNLGQQNVFDAIKIYFVANKDYFVVKKIHFGEKICFLDENCNWCKKSIFCAKQNYFRGKNIIDAKINAIKLYFVQKSAFYAFFWQKLYFGLKLFFFKLFLN
jgi:hypothetical protein